MTEEHDVLVEDFKATSDAMVADLERLTVMEDRKRRMDPEDPAIAELSQQIVELSRRVHHTSLAQRDLSEELAEDAGADDGGADEGGADEGGADEGGADPQPAASGA